MTKLEELKMILVVAAAFFAAVLVSELAYGAVEPVTAVVTFNTPSTEEYNICVLADDEQNIAQRYADRTFTTLTGQCTTAPGQSSVEIGNIVPGIRWYFAAVKQDVATSALIGGFSNEAYLSVPLELLIVVPLPGIDFDPSPELNVSISIKPKVAE